MHLFSLRKSDVPLRNGSDQPSVRKHPIIIIIIIVMIISMLSHLCSCPQWLS